MRLLFTFLLTVQCLGLWAQRAPNYFHSISPDAVVLAETARREFEPKQYAAFTLDYDALVSQLSSAPKEFSAAAKQQLCIISLPMADGFSTEFSVLKTSPMAAELEAKHPEILTLTGSAIHKPGMQVRITVSPYWGLRAMVLHPDKTVEYVQPVALGQNQYYMAYDPIHVPRHPLADALKTTTDIPVDVSNLKSDNSKRFSPGEAGPGNALRVVQEIQLKKYRFAVSCTGEFSQDHGGTKPSVFQKVTEFTNMLNAIYERDLDIRLELIPESFDIIFLDPVTDPFTGTDVGGWMSQNPGILFNLFGTDTKYDVGHVFARFLGGNAIGVAGGLCCTQLKGRGCSSWYGGQPYGNDFFAIVGQEVGHMWRSGHTFNQCDLTSQFDYNSACEPGSGSTIMSYSGICGDNNVSNEKTALYYHACSIAEIRDFVYNQEGATCGSFEGTGNNPPVVSTPYPAQMTIPISTPFELTGSAIDPDGDAPLTFSWDEIDIGPTTTLGNPVGDSPAFRWFPPSTNPTRTFPRIETVIANNSMKTEVLPTYNRVLNFAFVVRDNKPNGGGVSMDTVAMQSTTTAGPFLVSYPTLANTVWKVGEYQTVTWDVANTNNSLVNCQKVNIRLSLTGGLTYTVTLAEGVPNVGKACILVPNNITSTARIRVEAADNVFFDISNANFKIEAATISSFSLCAATLKANACLPAQFSTEISTNALAGFSGPITLTASGVPAGATAEFSVNPVPPGGTSVLSITFPANSPEGTFDVTVQGTAASITGTTIITVTTVNNDFSGLIPTAPLNGASGVNTQPLLQWSAAADATAYDIELAINPSFAPNTIVVSRINSTPTNLQITSGLAEGGVYFWRVRAKNECGAGPWSETQLFVVNLLSCSELTANDLPKNISSNGTPTIESKITLLAGGQISDINVTIVQGFHEYFRDLEAHLISPAGTDVLLWKDRCSSYNGSFNVGFDDGAAGSFPCPPPTNNAPYKSASLLSALNGQSAAGVWTLRVKDNTVSGGGSLSAFGLKICSNEATNPPMITVNNPLQPISGNNAGIDANFLKAEDANNVAAQLTYTLISIPQKGFLQLNGTELKIGDQFTQADVDNGALRYFDYGWNAGTDEFRLVVTDGEGGIDTGTFVISTNVGTKDLTTALAFEVSPNPADAVLRVSVPESLRSDAMISLYNAAGQQVRNWTLSAGNTFMSLQISDLPGGIYAVSIENEAVKGVKKVVIK